MLLKVATVQSLQVLKHFNKSMSNTAASWNTSGTRDMQMCSSIC